MERANDPIAGLRARLVSLPWIRSPFLPLNLLVLLAATVFLAVGPVHGDIANLGLLGEGIAEGETPHRDYWDTNPPLYAYLNVPAVWISWWLEVPQPFVFYALCGLGILLCLALMRSHLAHGDAAARDGFLILFALLAFLFPGYAYVFAQREHMAAVLISPYLVLAAKRLRSPSPEVSGAWATGLLAGIGFSIKPYFFLAWALVEAYLALARRSWRSVARPESLAAVGVGASYAAFLLWQGAFPPAIPRIYAIYSVIRISVAQFFRAHFTTERIMPLQVFLAAAVILGWGHWRRRRRAGVLAQADVFLLAALGFVLAALIQRKPYYFEYHHFPVFLFSILSMAAALPRRAGVALGSALAIVIAWPSLAKVPEQISRARADRSFAGTHMAPEVKEVYDILLRHSDAGDYVALFTGNTSPFPVALALSRRRSAMPGPDAWPIYHIHFWKFRQFRRRLPHEKPLPFHPRPTEFSLRRRQWEREYLTLVVSKLRRTRPRLILIPRLRLDVRAYLTAVPALRRILAKYRPVPMGSDFAFEVLTRNR